MRGAVRVLRKGRFRALAPPVTVEELSRLHERAALALLGFGVTLPVFLAPGHLSSPRLSDLGLVFALPMIVARWRRLGRGLRGFCAASVVVLLLTPMLQMVKIGQTPNLPDLVFWSRWIAAVVAATAAAHAVVADRRRRRLFFLAMTAGAACHLATYGLLEIMGRGGLEAIGLASPRAALTTAAAQARITTVAEHPNAAMALIGLAVPACLAASARTMERRLLAYVGACMVLAGFVCTLSRGGTLAAALAMLVWVLIRARRADGRNPLEFLILTCLLAGAALVDQVIGGVVDIARFAARFDASTLDENIGGRVETWVRALGFIANHPLGVGWSSPQELGPFRGLTVSHNGYLFMARTVGVVTAVALLGLHVRSALKLDVFAPLAVFVLVMMSSEDLTQGASFIFVACLTAALAFRRRTP